MGLYNYKYLTQKHLKGFDNYKYSAIDTSPLSRYVMHPLWNTIVKFIPNWVAPNLLTFFGFLSMVIAVILIIIYDYECYGAEGRPGYGKLSDGGGIPNWVYIVCGILLFLAYNLDGVDGKQARKTGVSGPLGEMFDHGLDSYIVFFIPFCLFSIFGRDQVFSVSVFRGYLAIMSVVLNFYVSHWEKYNTGTLYLPWGYDVSMWATTSLFLIAGINGAGIFKIFVFKNLTFVQALEIVIHATGLFTTLPIAVINVYLSYQKRTGKMYSLSEAIRPVWSILIVSVAMTLWALISPNNIIEVEPRIFLLIYGTLFSNIASRLIVAEMSDQRCEALCWLFWPLLVSIIVSLHQPHLETSVLYALLVLCVLSHVHYGICVVRQICDYFKISCFTVPKVKRK